MDPPPLLTGIAENGFPVKCKPGTLAYCPTMDLIAVATVDEHVSVFRLNGQRVLGGSYANAGAGNWGNAGGKGTRVKGIRWNLNGESLAVICEDNVVRILSALSGRTIHYLDCSPSDKEVHTAPSPGTSNPISCIGWGTNVTDHRSALQKLRNSQETLSLEDLLSSETDLSQLADLKNDLPRELALLDIESSLPKLCTLPPTGDDHDVFSSRTSVDSIFHANTGHGDLVDVLLAAFDDGTIHLRIFGSFEIGSLNVRSSLNTSTSTADDIRPILHTSHPLESTHAVLYLNSASDRLDLVTLDLSFITRSGRYLALLASKATQLQNLLRYIKQVQAQMQLEWKNAQDLPGRFIRNVNEDLQKTNCDFISAIYHLVATGNCFEPMREFLAEILTDRGHKRWDKAVTSGYEAVRRLTHECLLPALERTTIILSRLTGLSKFHKLHAALGLETTSLDDCQDIIDCLTLLAHKVLIHSSREVREFAAFSRWLKFQVDLQSAEPLSRTAEDILEKSDTIDHVETLKYVRGAMCHSALNQYIQPRTPQDEKGAAAAGGDGAKSGVKAKKQGESFYDIYKSLLPPAQQTSITTSSEPVPAKDRPPVFNELTAWLGDECNRVFKKIAEAQKNGIHHRLALSLGADCDGDVVDMTMNVEAFEDELLPSVYIASKSKSSAHTFYLYRGVLRPTADGTSTTKAVLVAPLTLDSGEIICIKFVEDGTLLLLWKQGGADPCSRLISVPYLARRRNQGHGHRDDGVLFTPSFSAATADNDGGGKVQSVFQNERQRAAFIRHTFLPSAGEQRLDPVEIEVNGRRGRRVVCVLFSDRSKYAVYDMDSFDEPEPEPATEEGEDAIVAEEARAQIHGNHGDLIMSDA